MIVFEKKKDLPPLVPAEKATDETIRKAKADRSRKADTDGTRRRDKQTAEDNRLI